MRKELAVGILMGAFSAGSASSNEPFEPTMVESDGGKVCEVVLAHYTSAFNSDDQGTSGLLQSPEIDHPESRRRKVDGIRGQLRTMEASIEGADKLFVYHGRSHSWRGHIFTGYLIEPDEIDALEEQIASGDDSGIAPFYPMGSLAYGANFSWWENLPFEHRGQWYVLADFRDFPRHEGLRNVYRIGADGAVDRVCRVKIFQNFRADQSGGDFPFLAAYNRALENIIVSEGGCGTSNADALARGNGRYYTSMAVFRPWAAEPAWSDSDWFWREGKDEFQRKHFEDWRYRDIWSNRERGVLDNARLDAIAELKNHYIDTYSHSETSAQDLATGIVDSMPGRYYSLGVYYNENKQFSGFRKLVEGSYKNWDNIHRDLDLPRDEAATLPSLSLVVDHPEQLAELPESMDPRTPNTLYGKDLLMFAAHMNNYDAVRKLVDMGWPLDRTTDQREGGFCTPKLDRTNRSALTYAAENASIELIKYLVSAGSDVDIQDSQGNGLDFYLRKNPRLSDEEKELGFEGVLDRYSGAGDITPGFSCDQDLTRVEAAICSSEGLAIYDRELSEAYEVLVEREGKVDQLRASQIEWLQLRDSECSAYPEDYQVDSCVARSTRERTRYLRYLARGDT